ncbi:hypothetical protein CC80DRAFT_487555 [Byssothecium circinans]|uniref:Uncharacterized protein n=1 Tax=Byssothecium circinans TaxID=147558 RepID=A0A6A5UFR6_9PLEO|nr:hypothetical protein CC80DRAFT_487555 [Byssothecium circinans]
MFSDQQVLEFATINLKDGVAPTDHRLLPVFKQCMPEIVDAGGEHFRFLLDNPPNNGKQLLGMTGIWPTDELHSKFLERGALMPLLAGLGDLLTVKDVIYLKAPSLSQGQIEVLNNDVTSALFQVDGTDRDEFEKLAQSVIVEKADKVLAEWNVTDQASFSKARDFCADIISPDQKQFQHGGTWGILVRDTDSELVEQIKNKAVGKFNTVAVSAWKGFDLEANVEL